MVSTIKKLKLGVKCPNKKEIYIGMGKTCKLKDVAFQCMTKFTTNKKNK